MKKELLNYKNECLIVQSQVLGDTTVTIPVSSPQIDTLSLWPLFSQLSSIMHQWKNHFPSKILDGEGGSVNVELHLLVRGQRSRCEGRLWRSPSPCSHRQTIHSGMGGGHCVVHQASESVEWKIIVRPRCKCTGRPGRQTLAPLCCRGGPPWGEPLSSVLFWAAEDAPSRQSVWDSSTATARETSALQMKKHMNV